MTITVDINQLSKSKNSPFSVDEITEINEVLELGWQIEQWEFLRKGEEDGQVVLLVIVNDDIVNDDDFNMDFDEEAEEEEQLN